MSSVEDGGILEDGGAPGLEAEAAKSLHLSQEACPCPLVDTHEALKSLRPGEVLEVITDHPPAATESIPRFCKIRSCPIDVTREGDLWRLRITRNEEFQSEPDGSPPKVEINRVTKEYVGRDHSTVALEPTSLSIGEGEFVCFVGPSGCGKTTLLNIVAGLVPADQGEVRIEGGRVSGPGNDRVVVFQEHALFPWLTVLKNVEFGLKMKGAAQTERRDRARELLRLVHLGRFENSYIHELSGGMKQRVAIARALAINPKVLLMDEPFAALDAQTRHLLHLELQEIWLATNKTILFVTHNVREAVSLADRVVAMSARPGRIKKEYRIDLARPRGDNTLKVSQIAEEITNELKDEIAKLSREELEGASMRGVTDGSR